MNWMFSLRLVVWPLSSSCGCEGSVRLVTHVPGPVCSQDAVPSVFQCGCCLAMLCCESAVHAEQVSKKTARSHKCHQVVLDSEGLVAGCLCRVCVYLVFTVCLGVCAFVRRKGSTMRFQTPGHKKEDRG